MKKNAKVLLVILLALAMLLPMVISASAHADNESYGAVNLYTGTMTLDGEKEEAYEKYGLHFETTAYEWVRNTPKEGFSGNFWWLFADDYSKLYVYTEVVDNTLLIPGEERHVSMSKCYHCDSLEIWIDPTNALTGMVTDDDYIDAEAYHYRTDPAGFNAGTMWGNQILGNDAIASYFETSVKLTDVGYNIEWCINTDVFVQAGQTELTEGTAWGVQMMSKNVYDELHYTCTSSNVKDAYCMNSFTVPCSVSPDAADHNTGDFDYIVLGPAVSDADESNGTDVTPAQNDTDTETDTTNTNTNGSTTNNGTQNTVNKVGDTMAIAAAALIVSAGCAVLVSRKRK